MNKIKVLDHGYIKYIEHYGSDEGIIECARMSTQRGFEGWGTPEEPGDERLLRYLWKNRHSSPFEQSGITVEVECPIFVARQWMRHRTGCVNEASARYTPLPDKDYLPTLDRLLEAANSGTTNKQAQGVGEVDVEGMRRWLRLVAEQYSLNEMLYQNGLGMGVPKELARIVLPVARYTRFRVTFNLRNAFHFLSLRQDQDAQMEIRVYADAMSGIIKEHFPRAWELFETERLTKTKPATKVTPRSLTWQSLLSDLKTLTMTSLTYPWRRTKVQKK